VRITVLAVNHGTTPYAELMLASLVHHHRDRRNLSVVVLDNQSPDIRSLDRFGEYGVQIEQSGYTVNHVVTTHGEILRAAVLARPDCEAYLFVDCDVCFRADGTIDAMAAELESDPALFAVQARWLHEDGSVYQPETPDPLPRAFVRESIRHSPDEPWPAALEYALELRVADRVHPFCTLIRNTPQFRLATEHLGLSPGRIESERGGRWWDTLGLLTQVMRTHGLSWRESEQGVLHFGNVSWDDRWAEEKARRRDELLAHYRIEQH
jgi:hypothetical protein